MFPFRLMHVTFVFFTLIFIPNSLGTLFRLSISCCNPFWLLATTALSSAYWWCYTTTYCLLWYYQIASLITASSLLKYHGGDSEHPCLTPCQQYMQMSTIPNLVTFSQTIWALKRSEKVWGRWRPALLKYEAYLVIEYRLLPTRVIVPNFVALCQTV